MEPDDPYFAVLLSAHGLTRESLRLRGRPDASSQGLAARRRDLLRELQGQGLSVPKIGRLTGLSPTAVRRILSPGEALGFPLERYLQAVFSLSSRSANFEFPEEVRLGLPYLVVRGRRKGAGWGYLVAAPASVLDQFQESLTAFKELVGEGCPVRVLTEKELGL